MHIKPVRKRWKTVLLGGGAVLALAGPAVAADSFTGVGLLNATNPSSAASGVSDDGSVVVGSSNSNQSVEGFVWKAGTLTGIGSLAPNADSYANGVSGDGKVVVGSGNNASGSTEAFSWTQSGGLSPLGFLSNAPGGQSTQAFSTAAAASTDGSVITGTSKDSGGDYEAVIWQGSTITGLGFLSTAPAGSTPYSIGAGISRDGKVVVGESKDAGGNYEAFRWTQAGGMAGLGFLSTAPNGVAMNAASVASGVSGDGTVVVGVSDDAGGHFQAFIWDTTSQAMTGLGFLSSAPNGNAAQAQSQADAISRDGKVVVGFSYDATGVQTAFRWTHAGGMQSVSQWLAGANVTVSPAWQQLTEATGVNADGSVVVGDGTDANGKQEGWIARVGGAGTGVFTPGSYDPTLVGASTAVRLGDDLTRLDLEGAHQRPLMSMVTPDAKGCAWGMADAQHHNLTRSDQQMIEVGACRDLADGRVRLGAGLGAGFAQQGLSDGGRVRYEGYFGVAEADFADPSHGWVASVTGLFGHWDTDIRRGYVNAGNPDHSSASPGVEAWAVRARVERKDLAKLGPFSLTPYAAYTHSESRLDAYAETGGGFPAQFAAQTARTDEVRVGASALAALSPATSLTLNGEVSGDLVDDRRTVSGQVIGLYDFSFAANEANRAWGRVGVEVDHQLGANSRLSASLDGATSGQDALWSANLRWITRF